MDFQIFFMVISPTQCAVAFFNQNQKTQKVWCFFWVNTCYTNQNLSKKPSVNRAAKILQPKNQFLSNLLKNPKGGPFHVKKILISNFAQISCVEFLRPKYVSFWISSWNFVWLRRVPPLDFYVCYLKSAFVACINFGALMTNGFFDKFWLV